MNMIGWVLAFISGKIIWSVLISMLNRTADGLILKSKNLLF